MIESDVLTTDMQNIDTAKMYAKRFIDWNEDMKSKISIVEGLISEIYDSVNGTWSAAGYVQYLTPEFRQNILSILIVLNTIKQTWMK